MSNPNPSPATRLKPGDPRINRKGRPKSFDAYRALAQQIAHEEAQSRDAQTGELVPVVIAGRKVTTAELVLRKWFQSKDARLQMHVMEVAFGKVPQTLEVGGPDGGPIQVKTYVTISPDDWDNPAGSVQPVTLADSAVE